jgi:transcriptional regulator
MYQSEQHRENRVDVQHDLIDTHPFGLLISRSSEGLQANGLPFLLQREAGPHGRLQAHIARANPQWRELDGAEVLVVFQGPLTYVTPAFYETKRETGKVVPTWNYVMVQARGTASVRADTDWLDTQIAALTDRHEADRPEPWHVSDAPRPYIEAQLRGIVGIEIDIQSLEGKWKVSQNRPEGDRKGVAAGLAEAHPDMAALVRRYGKIGDEA